MIEPTPAAPPRLWTPAPPPRPESHSVRRERGPVDLSAFREILTPKMTPFIPHTPTLKQAAFMVVPDLEAFYGGAAGGGKSDALLMMGLQYVDQPGYAGLLLRKSFTDLQLPGAIMDRSHAWLDGRADCRWNERDHRWEFESGAILQFGYLDRARDKYRYQSAEFQFVGFDELTQFEIDDYLYLATRLRRPADSRIPIRLRSASNPGGIGHEWVRARFIPSPQNTPDGKVEMVVPTDDSGKRRVFVRARLEDNPHVDREQYRQSLMLVDPTLRAQMLDGDWAASAIGSKFKREWLIKALVDTAPKLVKRAIYADLAATEETTDPPNDPDWTAVGWGGMTADGKLVIEGAVRVRQSDAGVESTISQVVKERNPEAPGAYPLWIEQEPGSSGKMVIANYARRVVPGYTVHGHRPTGDKGTRAGLLASMFERGEVQLVRGPWIAAFIEEYVAFTGDDTKDGHDDQVDMGSGLTTVLFRPTGVKSRSYIGEAKMQIIRKGDLVLRGDQYVDKEPRRVA